MEPLEVVSVDVKREENSEGTFGEYLKTVDGDGLSYPMDLYSEGM